MIDRLATIRFIRSARWWHQSAANMTTSMILGQAIVLGQRDSVSLGIEHLSIDGALLVGDCALTAGERVALLLHLEGERSLGIVADVMHAERLGELQRIAVRFVDSDRDTIARVSAIVRGETERTWLVPAPALLVVDDDDTTCEVARRDLVGTGWATVQARTSQDLVVSLNDRGQAFRAALVSGSLAHLNTCGVLAHLRDEHPHVLRVLLVTDDLADDSVATIARSRADVTLTEPWNPRALYDAIGLREPLTDAARDRRTR